MAKIWQQKKMKDYLLPEAVFHQAIWIIKDYERLVKELKHFKDDVGKTQQNLINNTCKKTGNNEFSYVEKMAIKIVDLEKRIKKIERAFSIVPEQYVRNVYDSVIKSNKTAKGSQITAETIKIINYWKQRVLYEIASIFELI